MGDCWSVKFREFKFASFGDDALDFVGDMDEMTVCLFLFAIDGFDGFEGFLLFIFDNSRFEKWFIITSVDDCVSGSIFLLL